MDPACPPIVAGCDCSREVGSREVGSREVGLDYYYCYCYYYYHYY